MEAETPDCPKCGGMTEPQTTYSHNGPDEYLECTDCGFNGQ